MGGGTGNKGGYKNEDAEGMCNSVASLEPDPRYSGCCSNIFRPGRVVRDLVVGGLVVLGIAVVIAVVFVVCFFFIPAKSEGETPLLIDEEALYGPYRGITEVEFKNNTRYDVDPKLERVKAGEHEGHDHGHNEHHHVGPVPEPESEPEPEAEPEPESEPTTEAEPEPEAEATAEPEPEPESDHIHDHTHPEMDHDHTHPEMDHDHTHPEMDHDHTHPANGTVDHAEPHPHHVPEASESEVTTVPATHEREGSLPPLFDLFSPRTPAEEPAPEGSEGTLKELVIPHGHEDETHLEEAHGVTEAETTEEVPLAQCRPRQLEMCSDLPHSFTAFPNWAGDQTEEDLHQTSLPFLRDVIVRSRCSPRAKEYSCAILEPPCTPEGTILPPCRTFCKSVASTCQEFITSRFSLSSAFDCEQFPDYSDPTVCFDMTNESVPGDNTTSVTPTPEETDVTEPTLEETTTLPQESETLLPNQCPELQCLDGTCISLSQVNDGVVDCPEGIDEEDFKGLI